VAASQKGGNEFNMAFDSLTAVAWLRQRGFAKVGSIGESQGGGAAIALVQRWIHETVNRNVTRLYGKPFTAQDVKYTFDAVRGALLRAEDESSPVHHERHPRHRSRSGSDHRRWVRTELQR